jgi:hypothetical protein
MVTVVRNLCNFHEGVFVEFKITKIAAVRKLILAFSLTRTVNILLELGNIKLYDATSQKTVTFTDVRTPPQM